MAWSDLIVFSGAAGLLIMNEGAQRSLNLMWSKLQSLKRSEHQASAGTESRRSTWRVFVEMTTCCDLMKHLFSQHLWICPVKPTLRATENKNCDICNCITGGTHRTLWDSIKLNTDISDWIAAKLDFWLPKKTRNVISFHPENTEKISSVNNKPMHV